MAVGGDPPSAAVALHLVPMAACAIDPAGVITEANAPFALLVGRDAVGEPLADMVEPLASGRVELMLDRRADGGPVVAQLERRSGLRSS